MGGGVGGGVGGGMGGGVGTILVCGLQHDLMCNCYFCVHASLGSRDRLDEREHRYV